MTIEQEEQEVNQESKVLSTVVEISNEIAPTKVSSEQEQAPPTAEQVSSTPDEISEETLKKICNQMEFYFSDANLARDKFMLKQLETSEWIEMSVFLKFKRIAQLTSAASTIAKSIRLFSNDLEVEEDDEKEGKRVKRKVKFVKAEYSANGREAMLKGIPDDSTLDELLEWLNGPDVQGNVTYARRRVIKDKFVGIAILEFKTKEDFERVREMELTFKDVKLSIHAAADEKKDRKSGDTEEVNVNDLNIKAFMAKAIKFNIPADSGVEWFQVKTALVAAHGSVHLTMDEEDKHSGCAEFKDHIAQKVLEEHAENPLMVNEVVISLSPLSTDEEAEKYATRAKLAKSSNKRPRDGSSGGRGRGRGKRGRGSGGSRSGR